MSFLTCSPVFAEDEDDDEYYEEDYEEIDELEKIDIEIEQLEGEKAAYEEAASKALATAKLIQGKIDSVSEFKRQLDEDAAVATADYEEKQAALDETVYRIGENETKLAEVTAELNEKHGVLKNRVRDIYINGQISYLDVLFGAQDFGDFLTRMDLLKRVIIRDSELVADVLAYQNEIKEVGKQLEADKKVQEELAAKAEAAKDIKLEKVAQQQALIDLMQNDKEIYNQQYDEMMASSAEVGRLIQENKYRKAAEEESRRRQAEEAKRRAEMEAAAKNSNVDIVEFGEDEYIMQSNGGGMIFPISGPITSEFGWRTHPIFGNQRFHSGLDIGGDYGMPIHAAQGGIVIEAGWIGGYGNTIMIDHGGGIVTLYGHNESLAVGVGQSVNQGDIVAYCGSTGNSTGPHCHFEVRLGGEPVSPWDYL
ncbi:MAG: peptidoglycan DD-metalloendopeptidase family protein [Selenomonadaceae bacterium]|nr:peptidoglycan DD-metalloendopeptidase family protein [Selenomonadaceae bacterium]